MKIHAVNMIVGGIPTDKRKKINVTLLLVQAKDNLEALIVAAKGYASHSNFAEYSFLYRNEFEEGPITWAYQTWERSDLDDVILISGKELMRFTE